MPTPDDDLVRYRPVPSLLAAGEQRDLSLEARRLSLLVRAYQDRAAIAERRAEGWRPVDDWFAAAEARADLVPRGGGYTDYEAGAARFRAEAEAFRAKRKAG